MINGKNSKGREKGNKRKSNKFREGLSDKIICDKNVWYTKNQICEDLREQGTRKIGVHSEY